MPQAFYKPFVAPTTSEPVGLVQPVTEAEAGASTGHRGTAERARGTPREPEPALY